MYSSNVIDIRKMSHIFWQNREKLCQIVSDELFCQLMSTRFFITIFDFTLAMYMFYPLWDRFN